MLLDASHKRWIVACTLLTVVAMALYIPYCSQALRQPGGGTWPGLTYGILGWAIILFCLLLGLRRKFPSVRIGRAETWLRGHIWLGLLSLPLILFHAGFRMGGTLTTVLMALFLTIILTGVLGIILQHSVPRIILTEVPLETIFHQIPQLLQHLRLDAGVMIWGICGPTHPGLATTSLETAVETVKRTLAQPKQIGDFVERVIDHLEKLPSTPAKETRSLTSFYRRELQPYLEEVPDRKTGLAGEARSAALFRQLRRHTPLSLHKSLGYKSSPEVTLDEELRSLETLCGERRQSLRQVSLLYKALGLRSLPLEAVRDSLAGMIKRCNALSPVRPEEIQVLSQFYSRELRAFLGDRTSRKARLGDPSMAAALFNQVRKMSPPAFHEFLDELESICEERRQLAKQVHYHHLLHGWLFVHVPLSMALLVLSVVHAFMALRY